MTINDKIKQILIDKNLTPSYFADEIGVQRSSISHILSGRNRPSFDIIQKIIRRFPELGYEWIMEEENQSVGTTSSGYGNRSVGRPVQERSNQFTTVQQGIPYPSQQPSGSGQQPALSGIRSQRLEIPPQNTILQTPVSNVQTNEEFAINNESSLQKADKKVERILIFYTDGSFREFTPSSN